MNIVLAHGFLGFSEISTIRYFNGVRERLESVFGPSIKVLVPQVGAVAGIEERGGQLGEQIVAATENGSLDPKDKVHIIAHSMGGLDARFMISENIKGLAPCLGSLTMIGTPHQGSEIADLICGAVDIKIVMKLQKELIHYGIINMEMIEALASKFGGLRDLTTKRAEKFNEKYSNERGIPFYYIAGAGRKVGKPTCLLLAIPHRCIEILSDCKVNDGLVSVASATRGKAATSWPADHADEIGYNFDLGPVSFDYLGEYCKIVKSRQEI